MSTETYKPMTDTDIIDIVEANHWQVIYNHRIARWMVQKRFQVVGNIAIGATVRDAVKRATEYKEMTHKDQSKRLDKIAMCDEICQNCGKTRREHIYSDTSGYLYCSPKCHADGRFTPKPQTREEGEKFTLGALTGLRKPTEQDAHEEAASLSNPAPDVQPEGMKPCHELTKDEIAALDRCECPDCGGGLLEGSCGGMSMNVMCRDCGSRFNFVPGLAGSFGKERISEKGIPTPRTDERDAALAELSQLREDKERLDWLDAQPPSCYDAGRNVKILGVFGKNGTLRAAIDAARKETQP